MSGTGSSKRRKPPTPSKRATKADADAAYAAMMVADKAAKAVRERALETENTARQRRSDVRAATTSTKVLALHTDADEKKKVEDNIKHLYASRNGYRKGIQKVAKMVQVSVDTLEGHELAVKLNSGQSMLDKSAKDLDHADREIEKILTPDEIDNHIEECLDYNEFVLDIKQQITHLQVSYHSANPHSTIRPNNIMVNNKVDEDKNMIKLPTLEVPTFSGDYREWAMFIDQFDSTIGSRRVDDVNKLSYLKKSLRGDAKASIFRLGTSVAGHYAKARQLLEERYGNKRLIARAYCHSLVTQSSVKANDGVALRAFLTSFNDAIEGLTQLGVDTTAWDCILVYLVMTKLDVETSRDYNMRNPGRDIPDLDQLLDYLADRAVAIEDSANDRPSLIASADDGYKKSGKGKRGKGGNSNLLAEHGFIANVAGPSGGPPQKKGGGKFEKKKFEKNGKGPAKDRQPAKPCLKCNQPHALYKCPEFDALSRQARNDFCRNGQICFNCLRTGHGAKECTSTFRCNICGVKHHTLLHKHDGGGHGPGALNTNLLMQNEGLTPPPGFSSLGEVTEPLIWIEKATTSSAVQVSNVQAPTQTKPTGVTASAKNVSPSVRDSVRDSARTSEVDSIELPKNLCAPLAAVGLGQTNDGRTAVLGTIVLPLRNTTSGHQYKGRALLDTGSQINFVSKRFAQKMKLSIKPSKFSISTVGCATPQSTGGVVSFAIPLPSGEDVPVHAYVFTQVTNNMPSCTLDQHRVDEINAYPLADPTFANPRAVDMLLGVEVYEELLTGSRIKDGRVTLTHTMFGYVVTGSMPMACPALAGAVLADPFMCNMIQLESTSADAVTGSVDTMVSGTVSQQSCETTVTGTVSGSTDHVTKSMNQDLRSSGAVTGTVSQSVSLSSYIGNTLTAAAAKRTAEKWDKIRAEMVSQDDEESPCSIDDEIRKFWEVNDIRDFSVLAKKKQHYTEEERFALKHFDETTIVDDEGYYVVKFPFLPEDGSGPVKLLGSSRNAAVRMLQTIHKKFARDKTGTYEKLYREFVQDLINDGHAEEVDERDIFLIPDHRKFYLPHHAVEKESTTTKLRVVMNASSHSSTKWSLNDLLAVGPKLQDDLICHLIRAGFHRVFMTGDVSKMYRTLKLDNEDMYYCLYLWQETPQSPVRCFPICPDHVRHCEFRTPSGICHAVHRR